jgi:hypothetical protein
MWCFWYIEDGREVDKGEAFATSAGSRWKSLVGRLGNWATVYMYVISNM